MSSERSPQSRAKRPSTSYAAVEAAVEDAGLVIRGVFHPTESDRVPALSGGDAARTLALLGNAGSGMWAAFQNSADANAPEHALDTWSRRVIDALAEQLGGQALYPFGGPPYLPFIGWAQRAEDVFPSPIGPLVHPRYGLWHAYRGAIAFADALPLPSRRAAVSPCETCVDQPCLHTCPVGAFGDNGYDVPACVEHVGSDAGCSCLMQGCLARRACPVGREYRYVPVQAEFHMQAFLRARRQAAQSAP